MKESCRVSLWWVNACVRHSPGFPTPSEKASDTARGLMEELSMFSELRGICSQCAVSPCLWERLLTHILLFRKQRCQIQTAEKTHGSFSRLFMFGARARFERSRSSGGCELEPALWVSGLDLCHRDVCYQEKFFTRAGSSVRAARTSKALSWHPRPSRALSSSGQMELWADAVFRSPPLFGWEVSTEKTLVTVFFVGCWGPRLLRDFLLHLGLYEKRNSYICHRKFSDRMV